MYGFWDNPAPQTKPLKEAKEAKEAQDKAPEKKEEAEQKAWYLKILDHSKGIVILSVSLAAVGATIYFMNSESAREQLSNSTLSTYAGQLLGAFGTAGSVLWNFGKGALAGLMVPLTYIPGRIGEESYGAARRLMGPGRGEQIFGHGLPQEEAIAWGFLITAIPAVEAAAFLAIDGTLRMLNKTADMYREYREQRNPKLREQRLTEEMKKLVFEIKKLQKDALNLVKALVPPSKILEAQNWQEAQRLMRELDTLRTESWKLDTRDAISTHELILQPIGDLQKINVLILAFKSWTKSQTPGGFHDNWDVVLKNLVSFLESAEKLMKAKLQETHAISWEKMSEKQLKDGEWKNTYLVYYDLAILLAQIEASQELIDDIIARATTPGTTVIPEDFSKKIEELKIRYKEIQNKYTTFNKGAFYLVEKIRTIIREIFEIEEKKQAAAAK